MDSVLYFLPDLQNFGIAGYWIILVISFAEALVFTGWVVPGTVAVVIAGGLSAHGLYDFWDLVFFAALGAILGDGLSFELGMRGKAQISAKSFLGKKVGKSRSFFLKYQWWSIFLGRFIGWMRPFVPFIAGVMDMKRPRFYIANILSGIAWSVAYLGLGYVFGTAWKVALLWITRGGVALAVLLFFVAVTVWLWRLMLSNGKKLFVVLGSVLRSLSASFLNNPHIRPIILRHPRIVHAVSGRFVKNRFSGLPLTVLIAVIIYSAGLLTGIIEDYLTNDPLVALDIRLANLLYIFRTPALLKFFYAVTLLGQSMVVIVISILLTAILWEHRRRLSVLALWIAVAGSQTVTLLGKWIFHRPRPSGLLPAIAEKSFSFPSGHATGVVALYGFIIYVFWRYVPSWKAKISALFLGVIIILSVDFSRLYLGVHYLSDVLAGNLVGFIILLFAASISEWLQSRWHASRALLSSWKISSVLVVGASVAVAVVLIFFRIPWKPTLAGAVGEPDEVADINSLFRDNKLPVHTETLIGTPQEPLNVIIIASSGRCVVSSFIKAKWNYADSINFNSTVKMAMTAVMNDSYNSAPMVPSFYKARPHDIGFEQETNNHSIRRRHHVRFWKTGYRVRPGRVFVGTASFDTGIKWGITHRIAPDIDMERDYLASALANAGVVAEEHKLPLLPPTFGKNFFGDLFFTDGKVSVITLRPCAGTRQH